jgi:chaperonin GroEL
LPKAGTASLPGDGTTTATVLASAIYSQGVKDVAAGCNPMDHRPDSQAAVDHVVSFLSANTNTTTTTTEIVQVTTISTNGDVLVGNLIAPNYGKVGNEGVITVKEGRAIDNGIEITEWMRFDRGLTNPRISSQTLKSHSVEFEKRLSCGVRSPARCTTLKVAA